MTSVNTVTDKLDNIARMRITLEIDGLEALERIFSRIQQLPNVIDVKRLRQGHAQGQESR